MAVMLGWIISVLGILFILLGLIGAARKTFQDKPVGPTLTFFPGFVDLLKALSDLLKTLITAPLWLSVTIIGIILLFVGQKMVSV